MILLELTLDEAKAIEDALRRTLHNNGLKPDLLTRVLSGIKAKKGRVCMDCGRTIPHDVYSHMCSKGVIA